MEQADRDLEALFDSIRGKSIAVVYTFRNESSEEFSYYDCWKSNIITDWLKAIEEVGCIPYISDVRTFAIKALEKTLPKIDFVVNLNAGNHKLESLGLVHSICGILNIPCIPNRLAPLITGEHKHYSNIISHSVGLNIPKYLEQNDSSQSFICRPVNLGSSYGLQKNVESLNTDYLKQEFISGFDITTPILFDPFAKEFKFLPSVYYVPSEPSPEWIHTFTTKDTSQGFQRKYAELSKDAEACFQELISSFGVIDFCRIDCRIKSDSYDDLRRKISAPLQKEDLFFLEINTMPTIGEGTSFIESLATVNNNCSVHALLSEKLGSFSTTSVVLVSSILARKLLKPSIINFGI